MRNELTEALPIESKHYARFQRALRLHLANHSKLKPEYDKDLRPAALNELLGTLPRDEAHDYVIDRIALNISFTPKFYLEWVDIKNTIQIKFIESLFEAQLRRSGIELIRGIKTKSFRDLMIANLDLLKMEVMHKNEILETTRAIWRRLEAFKRKFYNWISDESLGSPAEKRAYATTYIKNNYPEFYKRSLNSAANWAENFVNSTMKIHYTNNDLFKYIDAGYRNATKRKRSTKKETQLNVQVTPEMKEDIKFYAKSAKITEKDFVTTAIIYYIVHEFDPMYIESKRKLTPEEMGRRYKEITKDLDFKALEEIFSKMRIE